MHCLHGFPRVEDTPPARIEEDLPVLWITSACGELSHGGHVIIVEAEVSVSICGWPVGVGIFSIRLSFVGGVWSCPADVVHDEYVFCARAVRHDPQR